MVNIGPISSTTLLSYIAMAHVIDLHTFTENNFNAFHTRRLWFHNHLLRRIDLFRTLDSSRHLSWTSDEWRYRIEGGQKMVFASTCDETCFLGLHPMPDPKLNNKSWCQGCLPVVLCLYSAKGPLPRSHPQPLIAQHLAPYLMPSSVVNIDYPATTYLICNAEAQRPSSRTRQPYIPHESAAIQLDAARYFGPSTVLVEFKAKCALRATSCLIPPLIAEVLRKYQAAPYHVKNYLMNDECIPEDAYDPADLLAYEDVSRQHKAALTLLREKSRALRIFVDGGNVVNQEDMTKCTHYVQVAAEALAVDGNACKGIREIQAHDRLDALGAAAVMQRLVSRVGRSTAEHLVTSTIRETSLNFGVSALDDYSWHRIVAYDSPEQAMHEHNDERYREALTSLETLPTEILAIALGDYLQAAAAKDCSLLVSLCPTEEVDAMSMHDEQIGVACIEGEEWAFRIWVVDIGEKDITKISEKWPTQDIERAAKLTLKDNRFGFHKKLS